MRNAAADSSTQAGMTASPKVPGGFCPGDQQSSKAFWTLKKLFIFVLLALLIHLLLICFFGTRNQIVPRTVSHLPRLQLAGSADPLIALANPTLFALPNPRDFASATWINIPAVTNWSFQWSETPHWLSLATENPGATFETFTKTAAAPQMPLEVKPPPPFALEQVESGNFLPTNSVMRIFGPLSGRHLLQPVDLPSVPYDNVILPSRVQVLVDKSGSIISAVLLPSMDSSEAMERCDVADQQALAIARRLRFVSSRQLDFGELIFSWHAVPAQLNNTSSGL